MSVVQLLQTQDFSTLGFPLTSGGTQVYQILLYDATTLNQNVYSNPANPTETNANIPYFLTVNAYLANQAYNSNNNILYYGEYVGDFIIPASILPSSGVGNIYLTICPGVYITSSSSWTFWDSSSNVPQSVDVVVSLEVNGSTTMSPVYNILASEFGSYSPSSSNSFNSIVIPLSNMFTNISLTNILYRFTVYVYPIYS